MYNLIIYLYQLGVIVLSLFDEKVRKMWRGEREAIRVLREKVDPAAQYVWFHAASLGEFEQGRPLMEQLRRDHPEYKILLTFFSPSGYEVRKNYEGADIICYLPLDTITNARRFLRTIRPVMAFFIKYEFWYNYLHILRHRGVPVYSVSSIFRPGQIFFRWYGRQYAHVLKCFSHFYVQNEVSRELLAKIGIKDVTIVGDTRFDRVLQIKEAPLSSAVRETLDAFLNATSKEAPSGAAGGATKVFVAGSSWQPDEEIFIPFFNEHKDWKLIIAPHVIAEDHLQQIEKQLDAIGFSHARYTKVAPSSSPEGNTNVSADKTIEAPSGAVGGALIIDCFGLLSSIYRYADVTYVGGGFGVGIHNTLEAAVWDVPVIFGPNNQRFQEAQGLKACGGGMEITSADDFRRVMQGFVDHPDTIRQAGQQAGAYVQHLAGATQKILSDIL
jgi:3-deoxy-D-manno-octulosonic-acid transferase